MTVLTLPRARPGSPAPTPDRTPPRSEAPHLPDPPDDAERYSYLGKQLRWPFVWIFVAQATLVYAYVAVMAHGVMTSLGLVLLSFTVPPLLVNLWLRLRRRRVDLESHVVQIEDWRRGRTAYPSVDVVIACCGEDPQVLDNTFRHVSALEWPGRLAVHVLDDADDADTARLARAWGLEYVVRPNRGEWKKAGNLIHAFDRTDGDLFVVFDADFAPRRDFLYETVPYLEDERTGVLQTAQYFDVDHRVNEFARYAGTLQELFFRWIQPGRDSYGAAICAGTNVVYKREAVAAAGGFARVPLGEDVHSGVKIGVAGYRTRYVPLVLARGLAPDNWAALTNQQYRWCRSSMLLMVSSFFRDAPFDWRQRLCFWAAFLYYMASAALVLTSVLPTAVMLWFYPSELTAWHYLAVVPALVSTWLVFPRLARGWTPYVFRVCMINTFCHVLAVVDALRNEVQAWVPTGAVSSAPRRRLGVPQRVAILGWTWFLASQGAIWGGVVHYARTGHDLLQIWPLVALWGLQGWMLLPVLVRRRPTPRVWSRLTGAVTSRRRLDLDLGGDPVRGLEA